MRQIVRQEMPEIKKASVLKKKAAKFCDTYCNWHFVFSWTGLSKTTTGFEASFRSEYTFPYIIYITMYQL